MLASLAIIRERVLDGARLECDDVAVDVGAGLGLLALGALERLGEDGEVIAVDISVDCLEKLRATCDDPRVWYLLGSADVLPLPDEGADAVMTRSVLMYVREKAEAAREFLRVLRPGGRVSIREPVNRLSTPLWEVVDFGDLRHRVAEDFSRRFSDDHAVHDFDVEAMTGWFDAAGFEDVKAVVEPQRGETSPDSVLCEVGLPGGQSLLEAWQTSFTDEEVERLAAAVRAAGRVPFDCPSLYLTAVRP